MMKKYLMTGIAAIAICAAFTSCSKGDDIYNPEAKSENEAAQIVEKYNQAFLKYIGAKSEADIPSNQTWGFGGYAAAAGTRGNTGETYPATHGDENGGANMNHNEWADPSKEFGGWVVPDPLTPGQKLRVQMYFQSHKDLRYDDPELRHFFVQQVYKGGNGQIGETTEGITAADGSQYDSGNMNLLTVGQSNIHINDFNGGDCTESTVLNNGQSVGGSTHGDKITLMVNIDDTSCFGYHETGSSNHHNNKAALVSAADIDAWADANGNIGEAVTDSWNRSFLGFDLAIAEGEQAYEKDEAGNVVYATYNQAAESPQYAWDGENIIQIADGYNDDWTPKYLEGYENIFGCGWLTTNENFYVAADKVTMSQTISMNSAQASTITEIQNAPVLKDVKVGDTYYQSVINLPRIKQLVDAGYLPVNNKSLAEWVKVGKSDGYFSDWIVTLTEAQRIQEEDPDNVCIIAEDLSASDNTDFDFNDIVFTVEYIDNTSATVTLYAAGGTLPLTVAGHEVHAEFGYPDADPTTGKYKMINTGAKADVNDVAPKSFTVTGIDKARRGYDIEIRVDKGTTDENGVHTPNWITLTATGGSPAAKLCVGTDFATGKKWCDEKESIRERYPIFSEWVLNSPSRIWWR